MFLFSGKKQKKKEKKIIMDGYNYQPWEYQNLPNEFGGYGMPTYNQGWESHAYYSEYQYPPPLGHEELAYPVNNYEESWDHQYSNNFSWGDYQNFSYGVDPQAQYQQPQQDPQTPPTHDGSMLFEKLNEALKDMGELKESFRRLTDRLTASESYSECAPEQPLDPVVTSPSEQQEQHSEDQVFEIPLIHTSIGFIRSVEPLEEETRGTTSVVEEDGHMSEELSSEEPTLNVQWEDSDVIADEIASHLQGDPMIEGFSTSVTPALASLLQPCGDIPVVQEAKMALMTSVAPFWSNTPDIREKEETY